MSKPESGYGAYTYPNGDKYTGEWQDGQRHGRGKYEWPIGNIYQGMFQNGEFEGPGKMEFARGGFARDNFRDIFPCSTTPDQKDGHGVTSFAVDGKTSQRRSDFSWNAKDIRPMTGCSPISTRW